jgi:hypothetical protein
MRMAKQCQRPARRLIRSVLHSRATWLNVADGLSARDVKDGISVPGFLGERIHGFVRRND